jgi:hypothetical protein
VVCTARYNPLPSEVQNPLRIVQLDGKGTISSFPLLKSSSITFATHKAGNHAFRRFRNTYLQNYTTCPEGLYKYWMGHAGKDMSDLYDKIKEDVAFRRHWAEKSGYGIELPSVVPNLPRIGEQTGAAKAA